MEELQDASIHHTAAKLLTAIKSIRSYEPIFYDLQKLVCGPNVDKNDMRNTLEEAIRVAGLENEIRNIVYSMVRSRIIGNDKIPFMQTHFTHHDPLGYLRRGGVLWDRRVRKSLNAMCDELKIELQGQPRIGQDRDDFLSRWNDLSNYTIDLSKYRPVYAPKDLMEVLLSLKGPSNILENSEFVDIPTWEFSHIELITKNLLELRLHYNEILCNDVYNGIYDISLQCRRILDAKHSPLCQKLLKKGCTPAPLRGTMWSRVLDSSLHDYDIEYWAQLRGVVLNTDHIVDRLVFKDIQLTASNDDQYFVFEDVLYQVMLCFFRDTEINGLIDYGNYPVKGKIYDGPPSGVVPFHGICMFG